MSQQLIYFSCAVPQVMCINERRRGKNSQWIHNFIVQFIVRSTKTVVRAAQRDWFDCCDYTAKCIAAFHFCRTCAGLLWSAAVITSVTWVRSKIIQNAKNILIQQRIFCFVIINWYPGVNRKQLVKWTAYCRFSLGHDFNGDYLKLYIDVYWIQ